MKQRLAGLVMWALLFIPSLLAWLAVPFVIIFAPMEHARSALRAFDELPSASLFGGSAYMSLSAWSWERRGAWWADAVIWITNLLQAGHCQAAWQRETLVLQAILKAKQ